MKKGFLEWARRKPKPVAESVEEALPAAWKAWDKMDDSEKAMIRIGMVPLWSVTEFKPPHVTDREWSLALMDITEKAGKGMIASRDRAGARQEQVRGFRSSTPEGQAEELGDAAFRAGKQRVPAVDQQLMALIGPGRPVGGGAKELLDAWLRGWDRANLEGKKHEHVEIGRPPFELPFSISGYEERGQANIHIEDATGKTVWYISEEDLDDEIEMGFIDMRAPFESMIDTMEMRGLLDKATADEAKFEGPAEVSFTGGLRMVGMTARF